MEIFRSLSRGFLLLSPVSLTKLCSFWYGLKDLHSAQVSEESCPWPLKLMTSQRVERTWIRTGSYGQFRGEWVNHQIVEKRIKLNLHFKLSYLNSNFVLTLGYVNPALNNPALYFPSSARYCTLSVTLWVRNKTKNQRLFLEPPRLKIVINLCT